MARLRKIVSVVGTRPNFMKMAPVVAELGRRRDRFEHVLVHTGQHYDRAMSDVFFEQLGVIEPDYMLDVGSGPHGTQTALTMARLEPLLEDLRPDLVLVPGDVNSTLSAALTAAKLQIPVGHVEAGLRSFDRTMPEEVNRVVVDQISDLLFTHSPEAHAHLAAEGRAHEDVYGVGNTMIDTLVALRARIDAEHMPERLGLTPGGYLLVTLHRPALVDGPLLGVAMAELADLASGVDVVFPAHPRTRRRIESQEMDIGAVRLLDPMPYLQFASLVGSAAGVLTDSGGIQEETTYLGIPCFTLRDNTERPVTCSIGTNELLGLDPERIREVPELLAAAAATRSGIPPLWDGHAARRIVDVLEARADYRGAWTSRPDASETPSVIARPLRAT